MSIDTKGRIRGYVSHEDVFSYIKEKYDKNATDTVSKTTICPISKCTWDYTMNEHSEDSDNWYEVCGFIIFSHNEEKRMLFYCYYNINHLENIKYYSDRGLEEMVREETTYISLGYWGNSVEIIKDILQHFDGGWLDENDCDDNEFYYVGGSRQ